MKLKYILASFVATVALMVGCSVEEPVSKLSGLEVSNDYITLAADEGASTSVNITADEPWTASVSGSKVDWLSVSPASGSAGQGSLTISAITASTGARSAEVHIVMGSKTKILNVNQAAPQGVETPPSTVKEVLEGPDKTYKVTGTVTKITNTHYGNWYINDGTVEGDGLYIYGTLDKKGGDNNSSNTWDNLNDPNYANSWELGVGDVVTIEGPRSVYNGTVELVNVTILNIKKSLIDASLGTAFVGPEARLDTLYVTSLVQPVLVTVDADWVHIDLTDDGNYLLTIDENTRTAKRVAVFTIKAPGALSSVTLTQDGTPATGSSVTEIIAAADNDQVQTLPSTVVVALTTRGAVLSDGTNAIYAYGDKAAALKVGDGIKMSAKKTTYNGVPELTDITDVFVDSEGNAVNYPNATDITSKATEYTASVAEYIKLSGTLSVSDDGKYYNMTLDGIDPATKMGSIVYPVEALNAKSFNGKKITVTGYFNGLSSKGRYINIIATKISEFVDNPKGTLTNPYTPSEIAALVIGGNAPDEDVYIKGKVSAILYTFNASKGVGTFWLSDDGVAHGVTGDMKSTTDPAHDFECYSVYWFGNKSWVEGNGQVAIGDEVIVYGKTTLYNGVAETSNKKACVYSINGATTDSNGLGNADYPFNVAGAIAFINACTAATEAAAAADQPAPVFPDVCVKGKISAILYTFNASKGVGTFWLSDDGVAHGVTGDKKSTTDPEHDFECYSVYWFGNKSWVEGNDQVAVGDDVIVRGQLTKYGSIYETASKKAYLYSLNGKTE